MREQINHRLLTAVDFVCWFWLTLRLELFPRLLVLESLVVVVVVYVWVGHVGRQHQGMVRPGVQQVPEGSGEQGKMEKTGCKIICGAPTTLAVKGLMMMMMMGHVCVCARVCVC